MGNPQVDWNDPNNFNAPKRTFKVKYDEFSEAFSFSFTAELTLSEPILHEINNFWANHQYRLKKAKGDIATAVVGLLIDEILIYCRDATCITDPHFVNKFMSNREGWPGSGINITEIFWDWQVSSDDFMITEVKSEDAA